MGKIGTERYGRSGLCYNRDMTTAPTTPLIYPDSDGKPIAENTLQFEWIALLHAGFETCYADDPNVFVAADLLWYPVQGNNRLQQAPNVMVALGRPRGHRRSYLQWNENNIAPQIVIEILSPGNRLNEMARKFDFYEEYGVEEYYIYNPDTYEFSVWVREGDRLRFAEFETAFISPRSGIRFVTDFESPLRVFHRNGEPFKLYREIDAERREAQDRADTAERENQQLRARLAEMEARLSRSSETAADETS
jgi:Uma2 family endonuclease